MAAGRGASCTRRRKPRLSAVSASDWRAASATYARRRRPAAQRRRSSATIDGLSPIIFGDRISNHDDNDGLTNDDLIQWANAVMFRTRACRCLASERRETCGVGIFIRWPTSQVRKRGYLHAGWQFSADQSSSRTSDLANARAGAD